MFWRVVGVFLVIIAAVIIRLFNSSAYPKPCCNDYVALDWPTLMSFDSNPPPPNMTHRTPKIQQAYNDFTKDEPADIRIKKMLEGEPGPYVITKNNFPYHVASGIEHLVLWVIGEITEAEIRAELDLKLPEYSMYMNVPAQRSVKTIPHYQLFVIKGASPPLQNPLVRITWGSTNK